MVVKDNRLGPTGNKRPRLGALGESTNRTTNQRVGAFSDGSNSVVANAQVPNNRRLNATRNFELDCDNWSELFDSFKNTNHLKDLHCR